MAVTAWSVNQHGRGAWGIAVCVAFGLVAGAARPGWADDVMEARQLVVKAALTVEMFEKDPNLVVLHDTARKARGILIVPDAIRAAFVFGGSGGAGVLLARDEKTGGWHGPAFYTLGGASFGLQAGVDVSEVVILAMTERGVSQLLSPSFKLGGDASLSLGTAGGGRAGATANLSVDLLIYSRGKGFYGGFSVDGSVLATRGDWNAAFYGKGVTTQDILIRGTAANAQAVPLVQAVARLAGGR